MAALFEVDGDRFVPTELAKGPWDEAALHGGPPVALLARALERMEPAAVGMAVVRLTAELFRPVPRAPLMVTTEVVRQGRRSQLLAASLASESTLVMRATALRLRTASVPLPPGTRQSAPAVPPGPEHGQAGDQFGLVTRPAFHSDGAELRFVEGTFRRLGPAVVWIRLRVPLLAGEEPSPLVRAAAAADFGNGVSAVLPMGEFRFVNPDLTLYLSRPPIGEWVCLSSETIAGNDGIGLAESTLFDGEGRFGRSLQSLLLEARSSTVR